MNGTIRCKKLLLKHMKLDAVDLRILHELQADGSLSNVELARLEQLSPIPGIEKIRSSFALKQVRYKTALPLTALVPAVRG